MHHAARLIVMILCILLTACNIAQYLKENPPTPTETQALATILAKQTINVKAEDRATVYAALDTAMGLVDEKPPQEVVESMEGLFPPEYQDIAEKARAYLKAILAGVKRGLKLQEASVPA